MSKDTSDDTTEKERGWLLPDSRKMDGRAGLYLVATPIGNMGDISLRALDVLAGCDVIACEDTRMSRKLLSYYGISKPLKRYHDHSDEAARDDLVALMEGGQKVALISDAGTPLVSDPGYKLVVACYVAGVRVTTLPGANAPLSALQLSGLPSDKFSFIGFLPPKSAARQKTLAAWAQVPGTLLAFETGPRLLASLQDIHAILGARDVAIVREITKLYEEARRGSCADLIEYYDTHGAPKGEIVVAIGPGAPEEYTDESLRQMLREALAQMRTKDAAAHVAAKTGLPKSTLYEMALVIGQGDDA